MRAVFALLVVAADNIRPELLRWLYERRPPVRGPPLHQVLIPNCAVRVAASRDRGLIDPHDLRMSAVFSQCPKEMQYPLNVREWRPNSMQCCLINGRSVRTCGRMNVQLFSNGNSADERYSGSLRLTWNPRATVHIEHQK